MFFYSLNSLIFADSYLGMNLKKALNIIFRNSFTLLRRTNLSVTLNENQISFLSKHLTSILTVSS